MEQKHLTPAAVRLSQTFLEDVTRRFYATELMEAAHVGSGSLYPALARMEKSGWIVSEDEDAADPTPRKRGRPARRYYWMTGEGARAAHLALVELSDSVRPPASSPGWLGDPAPKGV
ncbi:PadR family transcriptional regulator [Streptomyces sp. NPDC088253]|uniref:PadR family transcriptional regulator n=1 Tax=Streptomyces sp. NPDC088253 TaxID=3365846 RepID=UPI0038170BAF